MAGLLARIRRERPGAQLVEGAARGRAEPLGDPFTLVGVDQHAGHEREAYRRDQYERIGAWPELNYVADVWLSEKARSLGIPTRKVDAYTFAFGSGLAGIAGWALTLIGNVEPGLGQNYIVDSFMVVVTGGVGKLAGTIVASLGIGGLNKLLEPSMGAVYAKVLILVLVILFLQRRPSGLFAVKGRHAEA